MAGLIPQDARSALDVGCGRGGFAVTLRRALGPSARLVGLEPVPAQAAAARDQGFDEVIEGYFPAALSGRPEERFDLISFNDVLEHVVDPWLTLRECVPLLSTSGHVLAAIPNLQYAPVSTGLVQGRWLYADHGLLDRTHLRFFTRESVQELFTTSGFQICEIELTNSVWHMEWNSPPSAGMWNKLARKATSARRHLHLRRYPDSEFLHFVVLARPV